MPTCTDQAQNGDEAGVDCGGAVCPPCPCVWGLFGSPELITGLELTGAQYGPALSADALTLIVSEVAGGGVEHLYSATRTDRGTVFSVAAAITEVNTADAQGTPFLSYDGLTLYFFSIRPAGLGDRDIVFATRPDTSTPFSDAVWLEGVNTADREHLPTLTEDELTIVFSSNRAGGMGLSDLWTAQRASRTDAFSAPVNLSGIDTADDETGPALSPEGLTLFFVSDRAGGLGRADIWMATRPDPSSPFGAPVNVAEVNSDASEIDPAISADGRELFFSRDTSGSREIWRSIRDCE